MDRFPLALRPQSEEAKFLKIGHKDRWECLKPVIIELYTGDYGSNGRKTATIAEVASFMRTHYSFHAAVSEYPHHFRQWNVGKRIVGDVKNDITSALGRRKRPGTSTSQVSIEQNGHSKPFEVKKLKRHLNAMVARAAEVIAPGLLSMWNLPYEGFIASLPQDPNKPPPYGDAGATPRYLNIQSPEALSPGQEAASPSPNMELVYQKNKEFNAWLFLQGRHEELLVRMSQDQRETLINYFHEFYLHGFHMAKGWGLKPSNTGPFQASASTPAGLWTPSRFLNSSPCDSSPGSRGTTIPSAPTDLCRWSVHVAYADYESVPDESDPEPPETPSDLDSSSDSTCFVDSLCQSITTNDFAATQESELPVAQELIVQALNQTPEALQLDAWKLAIMAGNSILLEDLLDANRYEIPEGIEAIHPFHLAASYLDGGRTCCMPLAALYERLGSEFAFYHDIDNLGHTILDALVVSILRSHTNIRPEDVSYGFHAQKRFPGEEKDICGRWDAESSSVRELFKQGSFRVPPTWKHPFCHTATQAVCHGILVLFGGGISPDINTPSGLFVRRCTDCGLELKPGPLHTLIITTFYMAYRGSPGETLFGALAVMVCLLTMGVDVSRKANISIADIFGTSEPGQCRHTLFSPVKLMQAMPSSFMDTWTKDCQNGWTCFLQVLIHAETDEEWRDRRGDTGPFDCHFHDEALDEESEIPCNGPRLAALWAAIQAELLTYRRVRKGDSWISENFSMEGLEAWLVGNSGESFTPLAQGSMLKEHLACGWWFDKTKWPEGYDATSFLFPTVEEVCIGYFMNMDDYERMSFLQVPFS